MNPAGWNFDNSYARLPATLFAAAAPARFRAPRLAVLNRQLAEELGLGLAAQPAEEVAAWLSGQRLPEGSEPIAQAYAGHQFGGFTMLGDGRAILLGEQRTPTGRRVDLHLKGAGPTRFSRGGDGLAALGPMLREHIVSEAMHALGIPTTRSLAVVATGEPVRRETALPGAVLARVAASHLRVGTFQYLAARGDRESLLALADYAIARHDPELAGLPDRHLRFLRAVAERQASLVARWQQVGFVHGVMNTDNVAISGETIDYGPCAFLDGYRADAVFSSIDRNGRYAFGNQPAITRWNLARFAEALLPLLHEDETQAIAVATEVIHEFPAAFERRWLAGMRGKLGLRTEEAGDGDLARALLQAMEAAGADWTNTFRDLAAEDGPAGAAFREPGLRDWHATWRERLAREGGDFAAAAAAMRRTNPWVIPRNHRVEEALAAATQRDDLAPLHRLLAALASPFVPDPALADLADPPPPGGPRYRTFCGT